MMLTSVFCSSLNGVTSELDVARNRGQRIAISGDAGGQVLRRQAVTHADFIFAGAIPAVLKGMT